MQTGKKPWRRTGLSRSILLTFEKQEDGLTVDEITVEVAKLVGPRDKPITRGAVWVIVERARQNGLISCNKREQKRPFVYTLTDGGARRIKWIKGRFKRKERPERVVANPEDDEDE